MDVAVAREDLIEALSVLGSAPNRRAAAASIYRNGPQLVFSMGGAEHGIPFSGTWQDRAHVNGSYLRGLAKKPPTDDPIVIFVKDGRLHIATSSIDCRTIGTVAMLGHISTNPDGLASLFHPDKYGDDNTDRARILAELELTHSSARPLIAEAARLLGPFGIGEDQIWRMAIENYEAKKK